MNGFRIGQRVLLHTPANDLLHNTEAVVRSFEEWGAHVWSGVAATGRFRAAWQEMRPLVDEPDQDSKAAQILQESGEHLVANVAAPLGNGQLTYRPPGPPPRRAGDGYTGDSCSTCGGVRLRRDGKCLICDDCGSTAGGCS